MNTKILKTAILGLIIITAPFLLGSNYLKDLLVLFVLFSILALSLNIIMGYLGQFSFGHQAFLGLGAYTAGMLSVKLGLNPWLGILASIALTSLFGVALGYVVLKSTRGVYFAIITYGVSMVLFILATELWSFTGGTAGVYPIPKLAVAGFKFNTETSFYFLATAILILVIYLINRWLNSRFGRGIIAIRENEELSKSIGINTTGYYVMAFTISGAIAGLAGALYAYYMGFINPMLFSTQYLVMMLIMVIVGGTGTIGGPILGSFIYVFLLELLPTSKEIDLIIFGVIVVLCVIFMPKGIYPRLQYLFSRLFSLTARKKKPVIETKIFSEDQP